MKSLGKQALKQHSHTKSSIVRSVCVEDVSSKMKENKNKDTIKLLLVLILSFVCFNETNLITIGNAFNLTKWKWKCILFTKNMHNCIVDNSIIDKKNHDNSFIVNNKSKS